ncbi:MAG: hypothetical protein PHX21_14030, partial [bacterium]|nr:hypothetical protein [bacterium]
MVDYHVVVNGVDLHTHSYASNIAIHTFLLNDDNNALFRGADYDNLGTGGFVVGQEVLIYDTLVQFANLCFRGKIKTLTLVVADIYDIVCENYRLEISTASTQNLVITDNTILQNNEINTAEFDYILYDKFRIIAGQELVIYRNGIKNFDNIAVDSLGNVYVIDKINCRIKKYDSDGNFLLQWGSRGTGTSQFINPFAIAINSSDHIYVSDYGTYTGAVNGSVQKFDSDGTYVLSLPSVNFGIVQALSNPSGLSIDSSDNIYVKVENFNGYIVAFDSGDAYSNRINFLHGTYCYGANMVVLNDGGSPPFDNSLFLVDTTNNQLFKTDMATGTVSVIGSYGTGNGEFNNPTGIAKDSSDNIYICDTGNNRIQKLNSSGVYVSQFGSVGTGRGQFSAPTQIATDSSNNLYIIDSERIQIFDSAYAYLLEFGMNIIFTGRIQDPDDKKLDTATRLDHIIALDFRCDLNRRLVKRDIAEDNLNQTLLEIQYYYLDGNFNEWDMADIPATGPTITDGISFDYISIYECFNQLAKITGYVWWVTSALNSYNQLVKAVHFHLPSALSCPVGGDLVDNATHFYDLTINTDRSQIANRIYVRGGNYPVSYRQPVTAGTYIPVSAGQTSISLHKKISGDTTSLIIYIAGGGTPPYTYGVYGIDTPGSHDFLLDNNNGTLYCDVYNGGSFIGTEVLYLTYDIDKALITMQEDTAAQTAIKNFEGTQNGIHEFLISDSNLVGIDDNTLRSTTELTMRKSAIFSGDFKCLYSVLSGWQSGQTLPISLTSRGFASPNNINVIITKVTWTFMGGNEIEYTIEFSSQVYLLLTLFSKLIDST